MHTHKILPVKSELSVLPVWLSQILLSIFKYCNKLVISGVSIVRGKPERI